MNNPQSQQQSQPEQLVVTSSPHILSSLTVHEIMWDVNIALLPAFAMGVFNYGYRAFIVLLFSMAGALVAEFGIQKFLLKKPTTLSDGSAILTGFLLAMCMPPSAPAWLAFAGGFIAISLGKQVYGGLGQNIFNPAHAARAIMLASWPALMTTWLKPGAALYLSTPATDAVTCATPLAVMKSASGSPELLKTISESASSLTAHVMSELGISFTDLFVGVKYGSSIGESSKLLLLVGGLFLLMRGHITWHAPAAMCSTVFFGALIAGGSLDFALFHLLSGGLVLGAVFMATDMVTTPITGRGRLLFGFGCGLITLLIRMRGGYPEGVCYSILIMNSVVPLIDRYIKPAKFGSGTDITKSGAAA